MFFVNHGLRLSLVFWLSVVWIYFYGILCGISLESAPLLCLQLPTSLWRHKFEYKHCCCCCSSLVSTWNMIIHYTSFKILKGKREKRKRQERTKNGEGKYKETTLTQLYLMQIASDFSFKIFFFCLSFFFFPVSCVLRMMLSLWKRENLLHVRRYRFSFCSSVVDFFVFEKKQNI